MRRRRAASKVVFLQLAIALCAPAALGIAVHLGRYPAAAIYWMLGFSAVAIALYGKDKLAAIRGNWRVSEGTLHLLAVAGGWPGAAVAQRLFNHKTSKRSFRQVFWLTVLLNCALIAWTFTASGQALLREQLVELHLLCSRLAELLLAR